VSQTHVRTEAPVKLRRGILPVPVRMGIGAYCVKKEVGELV